MTREDWLNAFADKARTQFDAIGTPLPTKVRVSIGFPSSGIRSKAIGECWSQQCSSDEHFEIFLHPGLQGSDARMADVLTHELVHAAVGLDAKHGPRFGKAARALGLEGKLTATTASDAWRAWALPVLEEIGAMPGASLSSAKSTVKKQGTRMLKLTCSECGFACRTTKKHIDAAVGEDCDGLICPIATCGGDLVLEGGKNGEED